MGIGGESKETLLVKTGRREGREEEAGKCFTWNNLRAWEGRRCEQLRRCCDGNKKCSVMENQNGTGESVCIMWRNGKRLQEEVGKCFTWNNWTNCEQVEKRKEQSKTKDGDNQKKWKKRKNRKQNCFTWNNWTNCEQMKGAVLFPLLCLNLIERNREQGKRRKKKDEHTEERDSRETQKQSKKRKSRKPKKTKLFHVKHFCSLSLCLSIVVDYLPPSPLLPLFPFSYVIIYYCHVFPFLCSVCFSNTLSMTRQNRVYGSETLRGYSW